MGQCWTECCAMLYRVVWSCTERYRVWYRVVQCCTQCGTMLYRVLYRAELYRVLSRVVQNIVQCCTDSGTELCSVLYRVLYSVVRSIIQSCAELYSVLQSVVQCCTMLYRVWYRVYSVEQSSAKFCFDNNSASTSEVTSLVPSSSITNSSQFLRDINCPVLVFASYSVT